MFKYLNGNSIVTLFNDGTRIVETIDDDFVFDYPLNIDIRVNTSCSLGYNPKTKKSICEYCHESAVTNGTECNYEMLKEKLSILPGGMELAIGGNKITDGLVDFLKWAKEKSFFCNLTVNHLHIKKESDILKYLLENKIIRGLGISYRKGFPLNFDSYFINHPDVVLHVITGVDDINDILSLPFNKVLVLGFKTFGFGVSYYNEEVVENIQQWVWGIGKIINHFNVVSFDNLAIEQLEIQRFFKQKDWDVFYQGEHSFYINAVDGYYSPSSRSPEKQNWNDIDLVEYFKQREKWVGMEVQ